MLDLRPIVDDVIVPFLQAFLIPLAGAAASWALYKVGQAAHVQVTAATAQRVEAALDNGINWALSKTAGVLDAHAQVTLPSAIPAVAQDAASYVVSKMPAELKSLGIDPASVAQRAEARIAAKYLPVPVAAVVVAPVPAK